MAHPFGNETAPMLVLAWGDALAPTIAAAIVARPALARRLALAPARTVHALAAFAQHALAEQRDVKSIAEEIVANDARDLLALAVPSPHRRLYGLLSRLGPKALPLATYERLNQGLNGPAADIILASDPLSDTYLRMMERIVRDPVLLAAREAIGNSPSNLQNLESALAYLRASALAQDVEVLPLGSGWKAILRRISSDLGRARAPDVAFRAPDGWSHVSTVQDLWHAGRILGNCVASLRSGGDGYLEQLISGDTAFLTHDGEPKILASVKRVGPGLWQLAETTMGRRDSAVMSARAKLLNALAERISAVGGSLVEGAPIAAMRSIAWSTVPLDDDDVDDLEDAA